MAIKMRGRSLSLYRRVPKRYETIESRKFVWVSLHTDSRTVADAKCPLIWEQMIEGWEARLAGNTDDAEAQFAAARELAKVRGFRYLRAEAVARLPVDEILQRVEAIPVRNRQPDALEAAAVLGGVKEPGISVSRALELYWSLSKEKTPGKSEDQLRRWKNPLIKAVKNFATVVATSLSTRLRATTCWTFGTGGSSGLKPRV